MAVVGYGHFGRIHAEKILTSDRADLVAIVDNDADRAADAERIHSVAGLTDCRELVGKVDAVCVVVPTVSHFEIAEWFLRNGVDVLVEKPITDNIDSARRLVDLANENARILQVGHLERFTGTVEVLRRHVTQPLFIDCVRVAPFKSRGTDVNVILDLMIHDLDLVLSVVDSPIRSVDAAGAPVFSESEDIASVRIKFANGCVANIAASRISFKTERKMRVFQADRYVTVDFAGRKVCSISSRAKGPPSSLGDIDVIDDEYSDDDPLQKEIDAFILSVANRTPPVISGEEGLRALKAAIMINDSMHTHAAFVEKAQSRDSEVRGVA